MIPMSSKKRCKSSFLLKTSALRELEDKEFNEREQSAARELALLNESKVSEKLKVIDYDLRSFLKRMRKESFKLFVFNSSSHDSEQDPEIVKRKESNNDRKVHFEQESDTLKQILNKELGQKVKTKKTREISTTVNIFDSNDDMTEEDDINDKITELAANLNLTIKMINDLVTVNCILLCCLQTFCYFEKSIFLRNLFVLNDIAAITYLFNSYFFVKVNLRKKKDLTYGLYLTFLTVFEVGCISPLSLIFVSNRLTPLALTLLSFRILRTKTPLSRFESLVIFDNNIGLNRFFKTLIYFLAAVLYFTCWVGYLFELDFVTSLYFVMVTFISVGYGDIIPQTDQERLLTMVIQTIGVVYYSSLLSILSDYVSSSNPIKQNKKRKLDILFKIYCDHKVPENLYNKAKHYIENAELNTCEVLNFIDSLPANLKKELISKTISSYKGSLFYNDIDKNIISSLLVDLCFVRYEKNEIVLRKGEVVHEVHLILKGKLEMQVELNNGVAQIGTLIKGNTYGESQAFFGEQNDCNVINVLTAFKGFVLKKDAFIRFVETNVLQAKEIIRKSELLNVCLREKVNFVHQCEKNKLELDKILQGIAKINLECNEAFANQELNAQNVRVIRIAVLSSFLEVENVENEEGIFIRKNKPGFKTNILKKSESFWLKKYNHDLFNKVRNSCSISVSETKTLLNFPFMSKKSIILKSKFKKKEKLTCQISSKKITVGKKEKNSNKRKYVSVRLDCSKKTQIIKVNGVRMRVEMIKTELTETDLLSRLDRILQIVKKNRF